MAALKVEEGKAGVLLCTREKSNLSCSGSHLSGKSFKKFTAKKHQVASKGTEQNACAPNQTAHFTDMEYEKIIKWPLNKNRESVLDLREFRSGLQEQKLSVLLTLSSAHWLCYNMYKVLIETGRSLFCIHTYLLVFLEAASTLNWKFMSPTLNFCLIVAM